MSVIKKLNNRGCLTPAALSPVHSRQTLFISYFFTVFIFVQKGQLILVPSGGFIIQLVVVDVFVIRLVAGTVQLQVNLFIVILDLQGGEEVLFLKVTPGAVVHGLRALILLPPLPDMM